MRVPDRHGVGLGGQPVHVLVIHPLVDDVPPRRHADLPLVEERSPRRRAGGEVEVGVVHHHQRTVAAELEMGTLEVLAGKCADLAAGGGGAGERDHRHQGVDHQRLPDVGATGQHMQQALRQTCLGEHPGQGHASADRGTRIRLDDDSVAERQCGRHRSYRQDQGSVERRDHTDDADRNSLRHRQPWLLTGDQLAPRAPGQCRGLVALLLRDV